MDITNIDLEIEKLVFLLNAKEGNPGIYELTWELSFHTITIEEKYKIAHHLLREILQEGLIVLERFSDYTLANKIESVQLSQVEEVMNNPASWYPCNEVYTIALTEKGKTYLNDQTQKYSGKLTNRFACKKP